MTAIAAVAGIVSAVYLFVPLAGSGPDEVRMGKYRVRADFPCRPKRNKVGIGRTETGEELVLTNLVCSHGGVTYSLSATEMSEQSLKSLPADAWASNTLDGLRAQPNNVQKSSSRLSHLGFPAIRMHFTDTTAPSMDMARLSLLTDAGVVMIGTSWHSGAPEPPATFTGSLAIAPAKN